MSTTTRRVVAVHRALHGPRSWHRRVAPLLLLAALGGSAASCTLNHPAPVQTVTSLTVRNRSFFDVNVYASLSPGGTAIRLGTVTGSSSATFPIRTLDLQSGGVLVVQVHAIGTRGMWTSDPIAVDPELSAVLDVNADPSGDCSRSSFYTVASALLIRLPK